MIISVPWAIGELGLGFCFEVEGFNRQDNRLRRKLIQAVIYHKQCFRV